MAEREEAVELKEIEAVNGEGEKKLKGKKISWAKLRRVDSFNLEAGRVTMTDSTGHASQVNSWGRTLSLAFQSIGIVYGDVGTSPLYVYASTFTDQVKPDEQNILGALSLIIYTLILVPLIKYVCIVLWANDNGNGGGFALYSLICRYARVGLIPNEQPEDSQLSNYKLETPSTQLRRAHKIKEKLESSKAIKIFLFLITTLGVSMVIGDGILTPCISVLSAVSGIQSQSSLGQGTLPFLFIYYVIPLHTLYLLFSEAVVGISIAILIFLFSVQRFGTDKVGSSFAPIVLLWFSFITGIGLYNLFKYNLAILRAFNPKYIITYFQRNGKNGYISLGGIVLCITGTEAMFADLGHFNVRAIQISFSTVVFPALLTAYSGQAAYLTKFPENVSQTFYKSIPGPLYWPVFVIAVAAAIIASQAMISGAFSIISQSLRLGCFPRVKVIHTSDKYDGQVYIPEINYMFMIACVIICLAFRTTENIGHAYGIAVVHDMIITTCLTTLIMLVIWKTRILWIVMFFVVFIGIEGTYLSSVLIKFTQGGFLPLTSASVLMVVMATWHYVHVKRYMYELKNKVSSEYIRGLAANPDIKRLPGIGLLYSELVQGIPPIFHQFISNVPSTHSVLVFVSIKSLPIHKVEAEERFLFRQVEPRDYRMFRCVVRYGYNDAIMDTPEFENQLVDHLKEFIRHEYFIREAGVATEHAISDEHSNSTALLGKDEKTKGSSAIHVEESIQQNNQNNSSRTSSASIRSIGNGIIRSINSSNITSHQVGVGDTAEEEIQFVQRAKEKGVVYLIGEAEVVARSQSSFFKKIVVNNLYGFLRKNFRQGEKAMAIPQTRLLRVGMTYEI